MISATSPQPSPYTPPQTDIAPLGGVTASVPRKTDPRQIPFRIMLEFKGNAASLSRTLSGLQGWTAQSLGSDCSHGRFNDGGAGRFAHVPSPQLRLDDLGQLETALQTLSGAGAMTSKTTAMRVYFDRSELDDAATTRFMKMHMQHEGLLFRLGQHGGAGRPWDHKVEYATPLTKGGGHHRLSPLSEKSTADEWVRALLHKGWSLNASQKDKWELRYLDSSLDAGALKATLQLLCGMVAAARDATWTPPQSSKPPSWHTGEAISRRDWNALMSACAVPAETRCTLERAYLSTGGSIVGGISEPATMGLTRLMRDGYVFKDGGRPLHETVLTGADGSGDIDVTDPYGARLCIPRETLQNYVLAQSGEIKSLPPDVAGRLEKLQGLASSGIHMRAADGKLLTPVHVAVLRQEPATVTRDGNTIDLGADFTLSDLVGQQKNHDAVSALTGVAAELAGAGFVPADGSHPSDALSWPVAMNVACKRGRLILRNGDRHVPVATRQNVDDLLLEVRSQALPADRRGLLCELLDGERSGRVKFHRDRSNNPLAPLELLSAVASDSPLWMSVDDSGVKLASPGRYRTWQALENRTSTDSHLVRLDQDLETLGQREYGFLDSNGVPVRSRGLRTLLLQDGELQVGPPGDQPHRVSVDAVSSMAAYETQQGGEPLTELRAALSSLESLKPGGVGVVAPGVFPYPLDARGLAVRMLVGQPAVITDPSGHARIITSVPSLRAHVDGQVCVQRDIEGHAGEMQSLRRLMSEGKLQVWDNQSRSLSTDSLPWHMSHGTALRLSGPTPNGESVTAHGWSDLGDAIAREELDARLPASSLELLRNFAHLKGKTVRFMVKAADGSERPVELNASAPNLVGKGLTAKLPRMAAWKWHVIPTKTVRIESAGDLARLAHKFGMKKTS